MAHREACRTTIPGLGLATTPRTPAALSHTAPEGASLPPPTRPGGCNHTQGTTPTTSLSLRPTSPSIKAATEDLASATPGTANRVRLCPNLPEGCNLARTKGCSLCRREGCSLHRTEGCSLDLYPVQCYRPKKL